jgi:hypothetical protein
MDFRRMLNENWPYKTAAVVLAVLMWLSVSCPSEMVMEVAGGVSEVEAPKPRYLQMPVEVQDPIEESRPTILRGEVFSSDLSIFDSTPE